MPGEEYFTKFSLADALTKLKSIKYLRSFDVLDDLERLLLFVSCFILA